MRDATAEERYQIHLGICPICHRVGFIAGPRGGMAVNVYCANRKCRAAWNVTVWFDQIAFCQHIGQAPADYNGYIGRWSI